MIVEALGGWLPAAGRDVCPTYPDVFPATAGTRLQTGANNFGKICAFNKGANNEMDWVTRLEECPLCSITARS